MASSRFWSNPTGEPKRAFRWQLFVNQLPAWIIGKVDKPKFEVTETELSYLNHTFYYPSRVKWDKISFQMRDPIQPDAAATVELMMKNAGYEFPADETILRTLSKEGMVREIKEFGIVQLDPEGIEIERWELINPWISNVEFGSLDYSSDEMVNIDVTVRFDWADITTTNLPADYDG